MIKKITVTNYVGDSLEMDLFHPEDSGFVIESIDGLGPVKSSINTSESATMDGTIYNSARSEQRNIVLNLKFLFAPTIEDIRLKSYKFFPNKKPLTLTVETDKRKAYTTGYVESNEPSIFEKEEGCQISIICPDPYFYSVESQETVFSGVDPVFEFPFENTVGETELILGEIVHYTSREIVYRGDSEVGVRINIHALGNFSNLTLFNAKNDESMTISTSRITAILGSPIQAKDDLIIDTRRGKKSMRLIRDGRTYNVLSALGRNVDWLGLEIGSNVFYYIAESGENNIQMTIENSVLYEGV